MLPEQLEVAGVMSQIFKPAAVSTCKCCGNVGHRPGDDRCPAKAPEAFMDMVVFHGGKNPLSNLHVCPHSCEIKDLGTSFPSSEHHYQFKKLMHHDLGEDAYMLLSDSDAFQIMQKAKQLVPDDKVLDSWKESAIEEMTESNHLKYESCGHVKDFLLDTALTITEATGDPFWGTGLNLQQMKECLSDYWPGENHMGKILMVLRDDIQKQIMESDSSKCKAASPLVNDLKIPKS